MKKLMVLGALSAIAGGAFGVSSGIVGYKNYTLEADSLSQDYAMYSVGVSFINIDSEDGGYTIDEDVFGLAKEEGDQLYTWDQELWNLNQFDALAAGEGWVATWADTTTEVLQSVKIGKNGQVWVIPLSEGVRIAGAIAASGTQTITFEPTDEVYMFPIANPFPIETTWGDLNTFTQEGDQLYTWDADLWNLNQFDAVDNGWIATWADTSSELLDDDSAVVLKVGEGGQFIPVDATSWTVEFNY